MLQPLLSGSADDDASALVSLALRAVDAGAEYIVHPTVPSLRGRELPALDEALDPVPHYLSCRQGGDASLVFDDDLPEGMGPVAFFAGDSCFQGSAMLQALGSTPSTAVLLPRCESDLQVEAALEFALGLSESLAGLVILAECAGAPRGQDGHGGSAIIHLGEMLAEAGSGEDVIVADVSLPVAQPEPRAALPVVPPLMRQRAAVHRGERPPADYLAELS